MGSKIFMFMDNVSGSSTDSNHMGWIPIHSIDFEVERLIEFKLFHEKMMPETSNPTLSKILITKKCCTASPQIYTNSNMLIKSRLIIDVVNEKSSGIVSDIAGSGSIRYESDVCFVSKYKSAATEGENPFESITLTVSSLSINYNPSMDSHELDKKSSSGYHFQRLRPL